MPGFAPLRASTRISRGGFSGEETLRKLFRRRTGLSMTEWRRSRRTG